MKNNPILHTLLALAIFAAGAGFMLGIYRIHEVRVMNEEIEQYKEAIQHDYKRLFNEWQVRFYMRGGLFMMDNPCLNCHVEHE